MLVGLASEPWNRSRVLSRRQFPDRACLTGVWEELYRRARIAPVLPSNARHSLLLAY